MFSGKVFALEDIWAAAKIAIGTFTKAKAFTGPFLVQLDVSQSCNLRCLFCNTQNTISGRPAIDCNLQMDFKLFQKIISELKALDTRLICFTGAGEPTLHKNFVDMVALITEMGMKTSLTTNGLINEKKIEDLLDARLNKVNVSLNAATKETFAMLSGLNREVQFGKVKNCILSFTERKRAQNKSHPKVTLSFVLNTLNHHEIVKMLELAKDLGADHVNYIIGVGFENEDLKYLLLSEKDKKDLTYKLLKEALVLSEKIGLKSNAGEILSRISQGAFHGPDTKSIYQKLPCYIGWFYANISASGKVYPCCACIYSMGDLNEDSFQEIWSSKTYTRFRRSYKQGPLSPLQGVFSCDGCLDCPHVKHNVLLHNATRHFRKVGFS